MELDKRRVTLLIRTITFGSFLFAAIACNDKVQTDTKKEKSYSKTQQYLFELLDNYKSEYFAETRQEMKNKVQQIYLTKLENYLVDTLGRVIDSITVTVDTVIQEGWLVTTQFHTREIEFKFGMKFQDSMPPKVETLYKFMKSLKPGSEVTVNFMHIGGGEVNKPGNKTVKIFRIFAYPKPLKL